MIRERYIAFTHLASSCYLLFCSFDVIRQNTGLPSKHHKKREQLSTKKDHTAIFQDGLSYSNAFIALCYDPGAQIRTQCTAQYVRRKGKRAFSTAIRIRLEDAESSRWVRRSHLYYAGGSLMTSLWPRVRFLVIWARRIWDIWSSVLRRRRLGERYANSYTLWIL